MITQQSGTTGDRKVHKSYTYSDLLYAPELNTTKMHIYVHFIHSITTHETSTDPCGDKDLLGGLLVTRCLQQVRVIIIPSSSDPPEQHAWSPVRLEAAAAVVDDQNTTVQTHATKFPLGLGYNAAGPAPPLSSASSATA